MKYIIALKGVGNSGKTTTIRILYNMMMGNGFQIVHDDFLERKDFSAVFQKNGKKIGITSSGDTYDLVHKKLAKLVAEPCSICVCACRTFDRVPPGTNAAIAEFTEYSAIIIEKTVDNGPTQNDSNGTDAGILIARINALLT